MSKSQQRQIEIEERRHKVAGLKVSGATDRAVVEALAKIGITTSQPQVSRDYRHVLKQRAEARQALDEDKLDLAIQEHLDRYMGIILTHWPRREDPESARVILTAQKGVREMLALDLPQKVELTGEGGAPLQVSIVELARLAALNKLDAMNKLDATNGHNSNGRVIEGEVVDGQADLG